MNLYTENEANYKTSYNCFTSPVILPCVFACFTFETSKASSSHQYLLQANTSGSLFLPS